MKILFLAPATSIHTQKWVNAFSKDNEVYLVTQHPCPEYDFANTIVLPVKNGLGYYLNAISLHNIVKKINPDVINVHYASGYGTLARIAKLPPYILNVWGSDVYDFPYESKTKMNIIKKNLKAAYAIASTSYVMKEQTLKLYKHSKDITVTPFGIDTNLFKPCEMKSESEKFIIGTVKTLDPKYGISTLIKAYNYAFENGLKNSELILVGGGPQEIELKNLAKSLPCSDNIKFIGKIPNKQVPNYLTKFDIYCALSESESESFGVAVVEAESCGIPVIVSDRGGLPEVTENNNTGFIVPHSDYEAAGKKILELYNNEALRKEMGINGRKLAVERYDWNVCVDIMKNLYELIFNETKEVNKK